MPACTRDAKKSNIPSPKRAFFWNWRHCRQKRPRSQFGIQHLESRCLLAGDFSPTIDTVPDLFVSEDAELQSILLSGISAGAGLPSSLRISASSQNESLISQPSVIYQAGQVTGLLELQPTPHAHGVVAIIVTVEDAGPDNNDATVADNGVTTMTFMVDVASVNDPPTLTQPASLAYDLNAEASLVAASPTMKGRDYGESHPGSAFTSSMDLTADGTGMIVGAVGGTEAEVGYVEVYQRIDELSPWTQIGQQLVGSEETALGRAVSLNDTGTRIAISTGRAASIMEFDSESATWVSLGSPINQPGIVASLAMDATGNLLAIATADDNGIPNAQLHRFDGTNWNLEQGNLTMGLDVEEDVKNQVAQSKVAMNVDGTRLLHSIAGCGCSGTGFAKVYERNAETSQWEPVGDRVQGEGSYGTASSISGDGKTITIGAPQLGTETDLFGNGLVETLRFNADSGQWLTHGNLITGTANAQQLGATVSLSHDGATLVIGSPGASDETANRAGKISIFRIDHQTDTWQLLQEYFGLDANGSFGWRAAISETASSMIVGARGSLSSTNKNGTLLSFSRAHTVPLTGITAGGPESQALRVTAISENANITGQPYIHYASGETEADLLFPPELAEAGMAVIEVLVEDSGLDGDLDTTADNGLTSRTFSFGVGLSNFETEADRLSLNLGKALGNIRLSTNMDGTVLDIAGDRWLGTATDKILLPEEGRMVLPDLRAFGRVELLLDEERNIIFDDPTAWRLSTPLEDGQRFLRGLANLNEPSQIMYVEGGAAWQNPINPSDIDASGHVSPVDILLIINELTARNFSDPLTGILTDPLEIDDWPNRNFDQNGSGHVSAIDALRVINGLAADHNSEGELAFQLLPASPLPASHLWDNALHPEVPHSNDDVLPAGSHQPSTSSLTGSVNQSDIDFAAKTPEPESAESESSTASALFSPDSELVHAIDDALRIWQ